MKAASIRGGILEKYLVFRGKEDNIRSKKLGRDVRKIKRK